MPLAGQVVGDGIRLVRPVGRGSHSLVYFGVSREGQPCAVKIFPAHLAHFADREYHHARGLDHPRLGRMIGRADVDGQPALVAALARGEVLFTRYAQRPAATHDRRAFLLTMAHVLDGLAYLHGVGLVHRDLKPENIIVETDGSAKLVDFDLSGPALETFEAPTRFGTAAFQSPEAARGEPLGPESDLYGVGILLGWGLHGLLAEPGETWPGTTDPLASLHAALVRPDRRERLHDAQAARRELLRLAGLPY
ncbi:serine/threonine protein kinase [Deinococcus metalli]|uniref:Serine/threonine protein kinase n=1 Tax=Deinococcus metalli TaxID=1141878 RepID=A0A7W8KHG0_9DEIO|nr:protein kinase [Deinococcus metalli]MBB5378251.1 serine/threonine protein kinase [Deinococcus metalli]GHF57168.1 serine/threonine protein kinase [Deinococcus metalli]